MIISHAHKFVFTKTKKTAGTSIEIELSRFCEDQDIITPISPDDEIKRYQYCGKTAQNFTENKDLEAKYISAVKSKEQATVQNVFDDIRRQNKKGARALFNHIAFQDAGEIVPQIYDNQYLIICSERHPLDRFLSFHFFKYRENPKLSRALLFFNVVKNDKSKRFRNFHLYSVNGSPVFDFLIRYDHLEDDFRTACSEIGKDPPKEIVFTKHKSRKDRRPASEVLGGLEKRWIQFWCKDEIRVLQSWREKREMQDQHSSHLSERVSPGA